MDTTTKSTYRAPRMNEIAPFSWVVSRLADYGSTTAFSVSAL